ncbi:TraM recognition domain-containing protein [Isoptericola sp. F-RaC21]|uniref:type IV secretory system conjugative DNA transfer family protein n=1 Tax=Isoptericola sp. F-RaC21 TaxID=3141452 RepID=UPI00315C1B1C
MTTQNNRRAQPGAMTWDRWAIIFAVIAAFTWLGVTYLALVVGHRLAGTGVSVPANPFDAAFGMLAGEVPWPGAAGWLVLGGLLAVVAVLVGLVIKLRLRDRRDSTRVDRAAAYMGVGRDIHGVSEANAREFAGRHEIEGAFGLPLGTLVAVAVWLYSTWEDMLVTIAGTRMGKTVSVVIPQILAAPGALLATSNKRDVVDATRDVRAASGAVRVFDPQQIVGEEPTWWWDPLSRVVDEEKAADLAAHFAAARMTADAKKDVHFESNAEDLVACCLLAAALDKRPITQVYTWATRPGDDEPGHILRAHGFPMQADQFMGINTTPDKERGSIYSTARRMLSCLTSRKLAPWITRDPARPRPHFDISEFVASKGTLYLMSKEDSGNCGAIVAALTAAVCEEAEALAERSPRGRMPVPFVGVLDEVANVCRWRNLPSLFSHYGSKGIILNPVLQSYAQGEGIWGKAGMALLWGTANVKMYLGGVTERSFLEDLAAIIGDYDKLTSSVSTGRGQRSVSQQLHRERILGVDELAALPKGRAVVLSSGSRPTLMRTVPWMRGKHANAVEASILAHDPHGSRTIDDLEREVVQVESSDGDQAMEAAS